MKIFAIKMKEILRTLRTTNNGYKYAIVKFDENGITIAAMDEAKIVCSIVRVNSSAFIDYVNFDDIIKINVETLYNMVSSIKNYTIITISHKLDILNDVFLASLNYSYKYANVSKTFEIEYADEKLITYVNKHITKAKETTNNITLPSGFINAAVLEIKNAKPRSTGDNYIVDVELYDDKFQFAYYDLNSYENSVSYPITSFNEIVDSIENFSAFTKSNNDPKQLCLTRINYKYLIGYKQILKCVTSNVHVGIANNSLLILRYNLFDSSIIVTTLIANIMTK